VLYLETVDPFDLFFEKIYLENYPFLVRYLYRLVHDLGLAEDFAHDIFLRIYKSRNTAITGISLKCYLRISAKNIAVDHFRQSAREEAKNKKLFPELKDFDESFYFNVENIVIEGEVLSTVNDVLEEFSERSRKIFLARIVENKTRRQVSQDEQISSYNIKKIEDTILCKLREKLKQYL
jgi:RNA polymerase sigma-70 factor (ECF subfamily)